jgi:Tol biopolymer transport system component
MKNITCFIGSVALAGILLLANPPARQSRPAEALLGAALHQEEVEGNLEAAIETYKKFLAEYAGNRPLAAQASLRVGRCYEKLGLAEARKAYQRIVSEYAEQRDTATAARARLAGLDSASAGKKAGMTARKLTDIEANGITPYNVSMDGRYFGGCEDATGNPGITDLVTGKSWKVRDYGTWNDKLGEVVEAVVSRDGNQIAYWLHDPNYPPSGTLRIASTDGKTERIVYRMREAEKGGEFLRPWDWSPDGKQLAVLFECYYQRPSSAGVAKNVPVEIALVSLADGSVRVMKTLARDHYTRIQFSPDGRYLAYDLPGEGSNSESDVRVLPLNGGSETTVASHPANDTFVAWAPDGDLLLLSERGVDAGLYRVRIRDGKQAGEPELLKPGFLSTRPIGVDRNGSFYYWTENYLRDAMIASIDLQTGRVLTPEARITPDHVGTTSTPSWSPDGRQLAYLIHRDLHPWAVAIRDIDTGRERTVLLKLKTANYVGIYWSWDSKGQAFLIPGEMAGKTGLFRVDAMSGEATLILEGNAERMRDWTKDGDQVFLIGNYDTIIRKSRATGEDKVLYKAQELRPTFKLMPDERSLLVVENQNQGSVLKMVPVEGGETRELRRGEGVINFWTLTPDGQHILYMRPRTGANPHIFELWILATKGGEPRKTEFSTSIRTSGVMLHPDGKRIAFFNIARGLNECWVLENILNK